MSALCFLEHPAEEQQQTYDPQRYAHNGTNDGQAGDDTYDHQHNAQNHRYKAPCHLNDDRQKFPDRGKGPQIPGNLFFLSCSSHKRTSMPDIRKNRKNGSPQNRMKNT